MMDGARHSRDMCYKTRAYLEVKPTQVDTHLVDLFACCVVPRVPDIALHSCFGGACCAGQGSMQLGELVAGIDAADIAPETNGSHHLLCCALNRVGGLVGGTHAGDVCMGCLVSALQLDQRIDLILRCTDVLVYVVIVQRSKGGRQVFVIEQERH